MIFHYQEISPLVLRPIIPLVLKANKKFTIYFALIDSGADRCIFNIQIAKALGIKLQRKTIILKGIAREKIKGNLGKIEININGASYETTAIFADISDFGHAILGQIGFFNHFDVRLNYRDRIVEIKKLPEIN